MLTIVQSSTTTRRLYTLKFILVSDAVHSTFRLLSVS